MGDHHSNGLSRAKAEGKQIVKVIDLGDDFALAGVDIQTVYADETKETLAFVLVAVAGKNSSLVGLQAVPTIVAELGRVNVEDLKASVRKALQPSEPA